MHCKSYINFLSAISTSCNYTINHQNNDSHFLGETVCYGPCIMLNVQLFITALVKEQEGCCWLCIGQILKVMLN